jgi:hypothetical protein
MYRVIVIASAGLFLAACSNSGSMSNPFSSFEMPKNPFSFEAAKDTINLESQPPGAEAKTSTGQTCRTPCALAVPSDKAFNVTFTLAGYQTAVEEVQLVSMGDGTSKLRPDPVLVELTPATPKKAPAKKVSAKPQPKSAAPSPARVAPPPMTPAQQQPQTTSPWPTTPQR